MRRFVLAIILSACGSDPTFLNVCFRSQSPVSYDSNQCKQEIVWSHMPLTVAMSPGLSDYGSSVDEAIVFWEREVGLNLFHQIPWDDRVNADITIEPATGKGRGSTSHTTAGGYLSAKVEIRYMGDLCEVYRIVSHELGHALGLAHDPGAMSIMTGELDFGDDCFDHMWIVTDTDRSALRARYVR